MKSWQRRRNRRAARRALAETRRVILDRARIDRPTLMSTQPPLILVIDEADELLRGSNRAARKARRDLTSIMLLGRSTRVYVHVGGCP